MSGSFRKDAPVFRSVGYRCPPFIPLFKVVVLQMVYNSMLLCMYPRVVELTIYMIELKSLCCKLLVRARIFINQTRVLSI